MFSYLNDTLNRETRGIVSATAEVDFPACGARPRRRVSFTLLNACTYQGRLPAALDLQLQAGLKARLYGIRIQKSNAQLNLIKARVQDLDRSQIRRVGLVLH